jgi:hypothetical protein
MVVGGLAPGVTETDALIEPRLQRKIRDFLLRISISNYTPFVLWKFSIMAVSQEKISVHSLAGKFYPLSVLELKVWRESHSWFSLLASS